MVQVFLRFETVIFNNNFAFCMMRSFCSMARVAGWILAREIYKRTSVLYLVCLKTYLKKLVGVSFVKVAWLHTTAFIKVVSATLGPRTMFKQHSFSFHVVTYLFVIPNSILHFTCHYGSCLGYFKAEDYRGKHNF